MPLLLNEPVQDGMVEALTTYSSHCWYQILEKKLLNGGRVILAHSLRATCAVPGKAWYESSSWPWQPECKAVSSHVCGSGNRERRRNRAWL